MANKWSLNDKTRHDSMAQHNLSRSKLIAITCCFESSMKQMWGPGRSFDPPRSQSQEGPHVGTTLRCAHRSNGYDLINHILVFGIWVTHGPRILHPRMDWTVGSTAYPFEWTIHR
eukprot:TRINITY_DN18363_c0_g2_i1.p1 TRINITY_DN18363_c0_g2~~TRINITY_DN18363_c0_g2_i1.p1  ORF type:complete len:115 (+),score=3.93 TRINITY_DN18363_c0_g2_i1:1213-1557(+)